MQHVRAVHQRVLADPQVVRARCQRRSQRGIGEARGQEGVVVRVQNDAVGVADLEECVGDRGVDTDRHGDGLAQHQLEDVHVLEVSALAQQEALGAAREGHLCRVGVAGRVLCDVQVHGVGTIGLPRRTAALHLEVERIGVADLAVEKEIVRTGFDVDVVTHHGRGTRRAVGLGEYQLDVGLARRPYEELRSHLRGSDRELEEVHVCSRAEHAAQRYPRTDRRRRCDRRPRLRRRGRRRRRPSGGQRRSARPHRHVIGGAVRQPVHDHDQAPPYPRIGAHRPVAVVGLVRSGGARLDPAQIERLHVGHSHARPGRPHHREGLVAGVHRLHCRRSQCLARRLAARDRHAQHRGSQRRRRHDQPVPHLLTRGRQAPPPGSASLPTSVVSHFGCHVRRQSPTGAARSGRVGCCGVR